MVDRILMDGSEGRIIVSKAGFNATLGMNDANKIFDSAWFFTGQIVMCGTWDVNLPSGSGVLDFPFPKPLNYAPAAMVYTLSTAVSDVQLRPMPHTQNWGAQGAIEIPYYCYNDRLSIPYPSSGGTASAENAMRATRSRGLYIVVGV